MSTTQVTGKGFLESAKETLGLIPFAARTAVSNSPLKAIQAIIGAKPGQKLGSHWTTLAIAGTAAAAAALYSTTNLIEDVRRLQRINSKTGDFYTPVSNATNTMYMSLAGTALSAVPMIGGIGQLIGCGLIDTSKSTGAMKLLGYGLNGIGKGVGGITRLSLGAGAMTGKGLDIGIKGVGSVLGKSWAPNMAGTLGKQFIWIYGLLAARGLYKWATIDLAKKPDGALSSLSIGGKHLFVDNDPSSPYYLLSLTLKANAEKRLREESQHGLFGSKFSDFMGRRLQGLAA